MLSKQFVLTGAFLAMLTGSAFAGPQFVDESGFAASGFDVVEYRNLKQVPVGQPQPQAVPGKQNIVADYNGAKWAFANEANRDLFSKDPAKYAPVFDGHCAYGVSVGGKVQANPHLWRIVDDKLYLNITRNVVGDWEEDITGNISKANSNWTGLEAKQQATGNAPEFDSSGAPVGQR